MRFVFSSFSALSFSALRRAIFLGLCAAVCVCAESIAFATPQVFEMRKSLPMDDSEPAVSDYYINAGSEVGFKKGLYVKVVRETPIHDFLKDKPQGNLHVTVAYVQIIQVEPGLSVARLYTEFQNDERPVVDYESILLGDQIDLTSLTGDAPKIRAPKVKRIVQELHAPSPAPGPSSGSSATAAVEASVPPRGRPADKVVEKTAAAAANVESSSEKPPSPPPAAAKEAPPPQAQPEVASPVSLNAKPDASAPVSASASAGANPSESNPAEKATPEAGRPAMVQIPVPAPAGLGPSELNRSGLGSGPTPTTEQTL